MSPFELEVVDNFVKFQNQWKTTGSYWVMRHQLLASCVNQAQAEQDLDTLISSYFITQIALPLGHGETLLLNHEDYTTVLRDRLEKCSTIDQDIRLLLCSWMSKNSNFNLFTGAISDEQLFNSLNETLEVKKTLLSNKNLSIKDLLKLLVQQGLLRKLKTGKHHARTIPGVGTFIKALNEGRNNVLRYLRNRKRQDTLLTEAITYFHNNVSSTLTIEFLLLDMIPLGILQKVPGPSGSLLLVK